LIRVFSGFRSDLAAAVRSIRRAPLAAAVVVLSLGAGIGVNTVVFSWLDTAVLRPLPGVRGAADLVLLELRRTDGSYSSLSWRQYLDYQRRVRALRDLVAFRMTPLYVGESGATDRIYGLLVSGNYFTALGLTPAAGRFMLPEEASTPGGAPVVVISSGYWKARYAASPHAIGARIRANGVALTIIGVTPERFEGTIPRLKFDLFLPATLAPVLQPGSRELEDRDAGGYSAIGVPQPALSRHAVEEDVRAAASVFAHDFPRTDGGVTAEALSFWEAPFGPQKFMAEAIAAVQGVLLLMLLSVCANTANLMLSRTLSRQREIGVRLALGATRWRIASLVFLEALLLAAMGGAAGALFASWGSGALRAMPPLHVRGLPITFDAPFSPAAVAFAAALGALCALVCAAPAVLQFARVDPMPAMRTTALRVSPHRVRGAIMGVQVALAVFVLIAGALALESFLETRTARTGFRTNGLLLTSYDLTRPGGPQDGRDFADRALRELRGMAGIEDAAIASSVPLDIHGLPTRPFTVEGHARTDEGADEALTNTVTPGYFAVMDVPFVEGTDFVPLSDRVSPPQAIVNDAFVRAYLPALTPIGRTLTSRGRVYRICGVVRTTLSDAFGEPPLPAIYLSYRDAPSRYGEIHIRTREGREIAAAADARRAIRRIDPELPIFDVRTMTEHIESNLLFRRIPARLFAVVGPMLAGLLVVGIYALVAYAVFLRKQDIVVRLAIGAAPRRVVWEFIADTLRMALCGTAVGMTAAAVLLAGGTDLADPRSVVFALVPIAVLTLAGIAARSPARRALTETPWHVLRDH
jgi:predicted permease